METIHIIVATGEWDQDDLRYRRHRLAEFLQNQPDTKEVIWVCPTPKKKSEPVSILPNGIRQWTIEDLVPNKFFRFGRYLDLFYKHKLNTLLAYLNQTKGHYNLNLWYTFPGFPLLKELLPWDKIVYDCSDLWAAPINGKTSLIGTLRQNIVSKAETQIIQKATTIFCTSDYLQEKIMIQSGFREKIFTFENGVEYELFANEASKKEDLLPADFNGTVLGFIGGIKPKLDFKLIREVVQERRDWFFLFVGPDQTNNDPDFQELLTERNVKWTGSVPPQEVPKYMNLVDIGIMPYKASPYNQAVFPLKLFEFLAAGKPVVGVHLPSTVKWVEKGIYSHVEPQDFIRACEQLEKVKNDKDLESKRRKRAQTKDWKDVFSGMIQILQKDTNKIG
jgi:teichuronic acid biosynthesis glycosyltransferase TuaH